MSNSSISFRLLFALALSASLFCLTIQPTFALQKMTDGELREVTGKSGFISSPEERKKFQEAKNTFTGLIQSQGLQKYLPEQAQNKLFNSDNVKPEKQAKILRSTTRSLLKNPEFLQNLEETLKGLAQLGKTLQQLNSLQEN